MACASLVIQNRSATNAWKVLHDTENDDDKQNVIEWWKSKLMKLMKSPLKFTTKEAITASKPARVHASAVHIWLEKILKN